MLYAKRFLYSAIAIACIGYWSSVEWASTKISPADYPIIVGCINQYTWEIRKPLNQTYSACYHGTKWWKNLRFPSKTQFKLLREVFKNKRGMVTAMTLINHESQFDPKAKGCHKGWCDIGLFQIRDIYWGGKMTQKQQMEWFRDRKAWQLSVKGNCYQHINSWTERLLRCVFARHRWDTDGYAKYPTERLAEWKFYQSLNF